MKKKPVKEEAAPGADLSKIEVPQIREWLKADVQRCISLFVAILDNEAVMDELSEIFYSRMKLEQMKKAKEGTL